MPARQEEHWDRTDSSELDTQKKQISAVTRDDAPPLPNAAGVASSTPVNQFRFRILVVDDEPSICELIRRVLESRGYEVLTAADGLEALHALGRSLPDIIISDLNMPRMSGFEFLAVVRKRFPHIATIAITGESVAEGNPCKIPVDAVLQKSRYTSKELCGEILRLLEASPIRAEEKKRKVTPLFLSRDKAGHVIITCSNCLRPTKVETPGLDGGLHEMLCRSCGTPVIFKINHQI